MFEIYDCYMLYYIFSFKILMNIYRYFMKNVSIRVMDIHIDIKINI